MKRKIHTLLMTHSGYSIYSLVIKEYQKKPSGKFFTELVGSLKSQGKDNPEVMSLILGSELFNCIDKFPPAESVILPGGGFPWGRHAEVAQRRKRAHR